MTDKRKTRAAWIACLLGFFITLVGFAPSTETVDLKPPPTDVRQAKPEFAVPKPEARKTGTLFARPFLFQLAGSDKMTGVERETKLLARYEDLLDKLEGDHVPKVDVSPTMGVATVLIDKDAFATVLPQDCPEYYARLADDKKLELELEVADGWAEALQDDLAVEAVKHHPAYLAIYNYFTILLFFVCWAVHLTLSWVSRRFLKKPLWSLKLLLWVLFFTIVTNLHPRFDDLANLITRGALSPLFLFIVIAVAVALLHQVTILLLHRYFTALAQYDTGTSGQRTLQRRRTLEQAVTFLSQIGWVFAGLIAYLYMLDVDLGSFFAGAGLVGVAIGVMARDIFLDFFNGINILAEDQFGVGDWIESGTDSGEVISFSLRSTKIRRTDGGLATIPNSELRRVRNHSNEWSIVDFQVSVTYRTDIDFALNLIMDEIALLDTEWQDKLAEPANPMGVQELAPEGVVLRVLIKTVPLAQWEFARRLNRRVKLRFDKEGIEFSSPRRILQIRNANESEAFLVERTHTTEPQE